jgi:hypothetical protein
MKGDRYQHMYERFMRVSDGVTDEPKCSNDQADFERELVALAITYS